MEVIAKSNGVRQSPQKVRVVANLIKDLSPEQALLQLRHSRKKAAFLLLKTLKSVVANAKHNFELKIENLKIKEVQVGPAAVLKRIKPRARGRGDVIRKRSSNIRVILETK